MPGEDLGFISNPVNGLGIVRARTLLGNLRLWDIPRSENALNAVVKEIGISPIPGLYLLMDDRNEKRVYIGQTEDLHARLITHIKNPDVKIKNWQRVLLFNDGRNANQSDLNDENIRLALENYLVNLLKINRYEVVTLASRTPGLSSHQTILVKAFQQEINVLLSNKGKVNRFITGNRDDEVYLDDARKILIRRGYQIQHWTEKYAIINAQPVIIRPGSKKNKGWQVTFRGSKSLAQLQKGEGNLFMPRGKLVFLPLHVIADFVVSMDPDAFQRDTIDIFIRFDADKLALVYKRGETDITQYSIEPYLEN